jgi:hypothetical protein
MNPGSCLILGGIASLLLAVLHLVLVFRPQAWRFFGAGEISELAEQGSRWIAPVTLGLVVLFAAWGVYALSGADVLGPLPLLQTVLIVISVIYILRGLALPFDLIKALLGAQHPRMVVFSTGALAIGLLYLVGTLG